jgi:hypothetical protein
MAENRQLPNPDFVANSLIEAFGNVLQQESGIFLDVGKEMLDSYNNFINLPCNEVVEERELEKIKEN